MATNFTFVPAIQDSSDGRRRMRSRTACESCRNKKRRCAHYHRERHKPKRQEPLSKSPITTRASPGNGAIIFPSVSADDNNEEGNNHSPHNVHTTSLVNPARDATIISPASPPQSEPSLTHQYSRSPPQSQPQSRQQQQPQQRQGQTHDVLGQPLPRNTATPLHSPLGRPSSHATYMSSKGYSDSPSTPRFVSDLDPQARLLDNADSPVEVQHVAADKVGLWIADRPPSSSALDARRGRDYSSGRAWSFASKRNTNHPASNHQPRRLSPHDATMRSDIVPIEAMVALSELYFAKIHPLLPIINEYDYRQSFQTGSLPLPLAHVVCLLAAKDTAAEPELKLLQGGATSHVSTRQFCSRVHASLVASLSSRVNLCQLTSIRILALLSLHHEGHNGAEQASSFNAQAIHGAQSLALHLRVPNDDGFEMRRLFWCLWVLDRLNAAMHSRPCMLSDHDIATEPITLEQSGFPAFDILFRVAKILNKVIALYRPSQPDSVTGIGDEMPEFSRLVDEGHGWNLEHSFISTLQIFYHATAILSHRLKTINTLPNPTLARIRQQLSAIQVIRYMQDSERLHALLPFPIIVYAASLAASVSYQQLRYSHLITDQEQARSDFNSACQILQTLRQKWESADVMACLSHMISVELNKVPSLGLIRVNRARQDGTGSVPRPYGPGPGQPTPPVQQQQEHRRPLPRDNQLPGVSTLTTPSHPSSSNNIGPSQILGPGMAGTEIGIEGGDSTELPYTWDSQTNQIFGGMDDMAWMYLDAGNHLSYVSLPVI